MAVESITAHKLRSFLVTLGIIIGITAVLVNAAMVEGFRTYFEGQIQTLGSNFVTIRPASSIGLLGPQLEADALLDTYLFDSVRRLPYVDEATAARTTYATIKYLGEESNIIIVGTEPGYLEAKNRVMLAGQPLTIQDRFNVVLGDLVMSSATRRPLSLMATVELTVTVDGKEVTEEFRVKGIVEEPKPGIGIGLVYIPVRTLNSMLGGEGFNEITLIASDSMHIDTVEAEAKQMLDRLLKVPPARQAAASEEGGALFGIIPAMSEQKETVYTIRTESDILDISNNITSMIQLALVAIAGISLLVGGIGIANVMLVTVSERTREIGVMKAVGAKNRHVLTAFLIEACVIGLLGGILGMIVAAAASFTVVPMLFDVPGSLPLEWTGIAIGICLAISLLSGLYPAIRASKMDPVEALRSE
jgi:putative ABC transport system permease protein